MNNMDEYDFSFLDEIGRIVKRYEKKDEETGFDISFLQIIGKEHAEVTICKLMSFLLDPTAKHRQGHKFLDLFLKTITKHPIEESEIFTVQTEVLTDNKRRIDIVLHSNKRCIPIEVKIYSGDREKQCSDYFDFCKEKYGSEKIFYLTIDGTPPSDLSDLKIEKDIILLSFKQEILTWLSECENVNNISPVLKYLLTDLKKQIRNFCGLMEDEKMEKEILNVLCKNTERIKIANYICKLPARINFNEIWTSFCKKFKEVKPLNFDFDIELQGDNLVVQIVNPNVDIIFQHLFSCVDILNSLDHEFSYKTIHDMLEQKGFYSTPIENNGFSIINENTKALNQFFFQKREPTPLDIYKSFTVDEKQLIEKLTEFVDLVYSAI